MSAFLHKVIVLIFCSIWFGALALGAENCIPTLTSECDSPRDCTDEALQSARQITFVDVNFSHCEVAGLRCQAKRNCERFEVIPRLDPDKIRDFHQKVMDRSNNDYALLANNSNCRKTNPDYIRLCMREVIKKLSKGSEDKSKFYTLLEGVVKDEDLILDNTESRMTIDYKKRLGEATENLNPGLNNSLIISGHSQGNTVWGGDNVFTSINFNDISKWVNREHIESLFFAACSTGGDGALIREIGMCGPIPPGRIYGINGVSPGNSVHSARGLADLLQIDEEVRVDRDIKKAIGLIRGSRLRDNSPRMLGHLGEMCELVTVEASGSRNFDPNVSCGAFSQTLLRCVETILFEDPESNGYDLDLACQFSTGDNGKRAFDKYLKDNMADLKQYVPLNQYIGLGSAEEFLHEDFRSDFRGNSNKYLKAIYRLLQTDSTCIEKLPLFSDPFSFYRLGDENSMNNILNNVKERFDDFLNPNGEYNRIVDEINDTCVFPGTGDRVSFPRITPESLSSRKSIMEFLSQMIQPDYNFQVLIDQEITPSNACQDNFEITSKYHKIKALTDTLLRDYVLKGETNVFNCNEGEHSFIYEESYQFESEEERKRYFSKGLEKAIDCLTI